MHKIKGFTLIELMIVVAILGVILAIAIPNYSRYLIRARAQHAIATLSELRFKLEQQYQNNRDYGTTAGTCPASIPLTADDYFNLGCGWGSSADSQSFVLTATGKGAMTGYNYSVNERNLQQTTAFPDIAGLPKNCWLATGHEC